MSKYLKYILLLLIVVWSPVGVKADNSKDEEVSFLAITINIPAYRLDIYEKGKFIKSYTVGVGRFRYKTPVMEWNLTRIDVNPNWVAPRSGRARRGRIISPGPRNPMGPVKMMLTGAYRIHGTRNKKSLGAMSSHGCVKMRYSDILELTQTIISYVGTIPDGFDMSKARKRPGKTFEVKLAQIVKVSIVYKLKEVIQGKELKYKDIYKFGKSR